MLEGITYEEEELVWEQPEVEEVAEGVPERPQAAPLLACLSSALWGAI